MKAMDILVAHHDPRARAQLCELLLDDGVHVTEAASAGEIFELLDKTCFHGILLGTKLEDVDCWRGASALRHPRYGALHTPIGIVCETAFEAAGLTALSEDLEIRLGYGPFDASSLFALLEPRDRRSILIIDDDQSGTSFIKRTLEKNFSVTVRTDATTGFDTWKAGQFDLVLLDVMLPERTGLEVLTDMLDTDASQAVVMLTAYPSDSGHRCAMTRGAWAFLIKPVRATALRRVCNTVLSHQRLSHVTGALAQERRRRQHCYHVQASHEYLQSGLIDSAKLHLTAAMDFCAPMDESEDDWLSVLEMRPTTQR